MEKGSNRAWGAFLGVILVATCPTPIWAESPYSLNRNLDLSLLTTGLMIRGYAEKQHLVGLEDKAVARGFRPGEVPFFDRWSLGYRSMRLDRWSTGTGNLLIALPAALTLWDVGTASEPPSAIARDLVIGCEVFSFASALPLLSKAWIERPRPLAYDPRLSTGQPMYSDADASFFSAHTTGAFAAAVFTGYTFQLKHPDSPAVPWIWSGTLGMAGAVGAMRIYAGMHFLSDVAAGALVGSACGYVIPRLHLNRLSRSSKKSNRGSGWRVETNLEAALLWASAAERPVPGFILMF